MGKKVIDVTKPWKRPNPIKGSGKAPVGQKKRKRIKDMGKGTVATGLPWRKPDFTTHGEPSRRKQRQSE